jgi:hypothetical protein
LTLYRGQLDAPPEKMCEDDEDEEGENLDEVSAGGCCAQKPHLLTMAACNKEDDDENDVDDVDEPDLSGFVVCFTV